MKGGMMKIKFKDKKKEMEIEFEKGSGNVFKDLGFDNPEEELLKSDLTGEIASIIRKKKLTQKQAAKILGVHQPRISTLLKGNFDLFSVETLMHFLQLLGKDIDIVVKDKPKNRKIARLNFVSSSEKACVPMAAKSC
jgi:predicted XRE-type DNA-binding protein